MTKALPQAKSWILDNYLEVVEGKAWGTLATDRPQTFSFAGYTKSLETAEKAKFSFWLPVISAGLAMGIILIAVFGNGYSEVTRHSHLSYFYTSFLFLWIACYAWVLAGRYFARGNASTKQAESAR